MYHASGGSDRREIRHFHLFCGLGGGARGFNRGRARVGAMEAAFRCIGGIDVDPAAIRDFERLSGARGTVLDLFDRAQYVAFHGCEPPEDWRETTPQDIHRGAGHERPHIVFLSPPCKGFSGLLSETASRSLKYQALNRLALRGIFLMLEAWADDPVELVVFENVPRIAQRGRRLLDQITALLRRYGYAVAETTHDCGELGGLAQRRKRFLLVARHERKVPPFLYEPEKRPVRGVGEVLERLPVPGPEPVLPMHRVPSLQWSTWIRLAFVEAGKDWRSLSRLRVENGVLADYALAPELWYGGVLGVNAWDASCATITGRSSATNGAYSVADPRLEAHPTYQSVQLGVKRWDETSGVVTTKCVPGQGHFAVADPRLDTTRYNHAYRIVEWDAAAPAIAGGGGPGGGLAVADPRTGWPDSAHRSKLSVQGWDETGKTVTGSDRVASGALCVADPRPDFARNGRNAYLTAGHYGVVPWDGTSGAVTAAGQHDNGKWAIADPRIEGAHALPGETDRLFTVIRALDGTWHRPFTTLELAALQSLVDPEEVLELEGLSDSAWRERIGNAVPPAAAEAIASEMGRTLLLAWSGESFLLSNAPIWVRPIAIALAVKPASLDA